MQMSGKRQVHHSSERKMLGEEGEVAVALSTLLKTINHARDPVSIIMKQGRGEERKEREIACVTVEQDKRFWSIWAEGESRETKQAQAEKPCGQNTTRLCCSEVRVSEDLAQRWQEHRR